MTLGGFKKWAAAALFIFTTLGMTATGAEARERLYVRVRPPAPIVEVRPVAPGRNHIWVPGYHRWSGSAYVWVPGVWQAPPRPHARWVAGHWAHDRHGWFFEEGRWR
jgi:hypothetical protein